MPKFSLSKTRPGIYINNGIVVFSVQVRPRGKLSRRLAEAIDAAKEKFLEVYLPPKPKE